MKTWIVAVAATLAIGSSGLCQAGSYANDFSSGVGAASLRGSAVLDSGSVRLTPNSGSEEGSLVIDPLDGSRPVQSFDASFTLAIGPTGSPPADGMSFSFGPAPSGTYGEAGAPFGIVVTFDLYDNNESPTPPVVRIVVNGTQVAAQQVTLVTGGSFVPVTIHYDASGLDVNFNSGAASFTNVSTSGFVPSPHFQFTFGARTGGSWAEQRIDDVSITTTTTSRAAIPTLGEWSMLAMAGLLACLGAYALRRRPAPRAPSRRA